MRQNDPRAVLADALHTWMTPEQVMYLIDEVLSIDKRMPVEIQCPNCNHSWKSSLHVPDAKAVVGALTQLLSEGFGRPDVAKGDDTQIVFKRLVVLSDVEEKKPGRRKK